MDDVFVDFVEERDFVLETLLLECRPFQLREIFFCLSMFEGVVACDESCCAFVDFF